MPFALQSTTPCANHNVTFACALETPDPLRQDVLLRQAWETALRERPQSARPYFAMVRNRKWVAAAGFHRLLEFARTLPEADAEQLMLRAADHDPSVALRELRALAGLPYAQRVIERAARESPGEAVGVASGRSPTARELLEMLRGSKDSTIQRLAKLAQDQSTDLPTRQRAAILGDTDYRDARDERRYFARLVEKQPVSRHVIEFAQAKVREFRQSANQVSWNAKERYLLAVYGRDELDADVWGRLQPAAGFSSLLPHPRTFFYDAILFGQKQRIPPDVLPGLFRGIAQAANPLEETLQAANIVDVLQSSSELNAAATIIIEEHSKAGMYQPLYGLLAAHLSPRLPAGHSLQPVAEKYQRYLNAPQSLAVDPLFSHQGASLHRYFFYDDEDGAESYQTFLASYRNTRDWTVQVHPDWVLITGRHGSRRIEIYANTPLHASSDASIAEALNGREPEVVVHRGHAFHLQKSLRRLTSSARLVFLGNCRGMESIAAVLDTAPQAQIFATRGIGSQIVNDPLLKALNDRLLRAGADLDWKEFWQAEQTRFRGNGLFADYIPPHLNTQAILLRAYYSYLSGD